LNQSTPRTVREWRKFLRGRSAGHPPSGWPGHKPASKQDIVATEVRLGVWLPPSYRNFLLASNGWTSTADGHCALRKVEEIGWLPDLDPELLASWAALAASDYFAESHRVLERCLVLSGAADGNFLLLNADDAAGNHEWAAYW
jgi:hypothetical protein